MTSNRISRIHRASRRWLRLGTLMALAVSLSISETRADAPPERYQLTTDTVLDTQTGLTWQRQIPASPCGGSPECTQAQAISYCNTLSLAGGGWRLPNVKELQTIVDRTRTNPAIDPVAFPATPAFWFWTSSAVAGLPTNAWDVNFTNGAVTNFSVSVQDRVRCVR